TTTTLSDSAFTGRVGATYLFDFGLAPYVAYTTSFQPTSGVAFGGAAFKPTKGKQIEGGVKYQPTGFNSFITATAFNMTQQDVLTPDPAHTG
ncbi:TonB-dependent receptor, partial [Acinetobacter baumannii]